ncbi:hypothetical protein AO441_000315, partial [Nakaseomyces glabratus]
MWSIYVLLISLISRVLSATDGSFVISDPTYVYNGDINVPDAGYILNTGGIAKEITVNGNINVATYFSVVSAGHTGGPGYFFTYHGGSISVPGNGMEISNNQATGPSTIVMTGDSFTGRGFVFSTPVKQGSTAYLDFGSIDVEESKIYDFQSLQLSPRTKHKLGEFTLHNSDMFFEGAVQIDSDDTIIASDGSTLWFDSPDETKFDGAVWMGQGDRNTFNAINVKDSVATKPFNVKIRSLYEYPFYMSFDTTIQSYKLGAIVPDKDIGCYLPLTIQTNKNTHTFYLITNDDLDFCDTRCIGQVNFIQQKRTVNKNGTMVDLDSVYFEWAIRRNCPIRSDKVITRTSLEPCSVYETYEIIYSNFEHSLHHTNLGNSTSCPFFTTTVSKDRLVEVDIITYYIASDDTGQHIATKTVTVKVEEPDYTTTYTSDGHTITEVVSHITTTDSDGKTVTITTTMASFDQVDEGVFTSPEPYSQPPVVTSTVTEDDGSSKTVVISYFPSEGEDGVTRTGTTTISTITPAEQDYTTTITSDGHTITEVVSHITTTDSDGKTVTITTTMASFAQVDEGVFTSPEPYSQPPVVTSTVTEDDGSSKTVVISYFPSEGEDGVTRTGTTTVSTIIPEEPD